MANITGFGGGAVLETPHLQQQQHPLHQQQQQQQQMMYSNPANPTEIGKGAYVKILEQPAENKLRFR